jgi:hypothetical protein
MNNLLGKDTGEKIEKLLQTSGSGAEQERHESHFGLENDQLNAAKEAILKAKGEGAEHDIYKNKFGLGKYLDL